MKAMTEKKNNNVLKFIINKIARFHNSKIIIMSKLYYRLNSLCTILKQEQLIDDYDISNLRFEIDEKKLDKNYELLLFKFEHDNKKFRVYRDCLMLLNDKLD
jgi:hypothetical protein